MHITCIYTITCKANGRSYVGSAKDFTGRKNRHLHLLRKGAHHSRHLQRCWDKYGAEAFRFTVLEIVDDPRNLLAREQHHIDLLSPALNGRRLASSSLGHKLTEEAKARISQRLTTYYETHPGPNLGRKFSEESRQRMSRAKQGIAFFRGKKHTPAARAKMSQAKQGPNRPNIRAVDQYSRDGVFIARYEALVDAARETGAHVGSIRHVLAGRARLAAGYIWRDPSVELHSPAPVTPSIHGTLLPGLRGERLKRGWSVNRLRKEAKLKHDTVTYLERLERGASSPTLCKLAAALGVETQCLTLQP